MKYQTWADKTLLALFVILAVVLCGLFSLISFASLDASAIYAGF